MMIRHLPLLALVLATAVHAADPPEFQWKEVQIDTIQIGYGLQMADINGDARVDIVLADKTHHIDGKWVDVVKAEDRRKG